MLWYPLTFMIYIYSYIYICIATPNNPEICKTTTTVLRCSFLWRFPNMGTPKSSIWSDVPWKKHIQLLGYPPWLCNPQIPADPRWSSRNCRSLSWNQMNGGEVQPNYETLLTPDFILTVTWDLFHLFHPQPKSKTVVWYGLIVLKPTTATHYNIKHPHSMVPHMHKSPNHGFCVVFNIRKGLSRLESLFVGPKWPANTCICSHFKRSHQYQTWPFFGFQLSLRLRYVW